MLREAEPSCGLLRERFRTRLPKVALYFTQRINLRDHVWTPTFLDRDSQGGRRLVHTKSLRALESLTAE